MGFLDLFKNTEESDQALNGLHLDLRHEFPNHDDDFLAKMACIAGLLAKVAHIDFDLSKQEKASMSGHLVKFGHFEKEDVEHLIHLATGKMDKLKGLHTRDYCTPLNTLMSKNERFEILKILFSVAASDQNVDQDEVEAIRNICTALLLEHKHFIAAKATVLEYLGTLK